MISFRFRPISPALRFLETHPHLQCTRKSALILSTAGRFTKVLRFRHKPEGFPYSGTDRQFSQPRPRDPLKAFGPSPDFPANHAKSEVVMGNGMPKLAQSRALPELVQVVPLGQLPEANHSAGGAAPQQQLSAA